MLLLSGCTSNTADKAEVNEPATANSLPSFELTAVGMTAVSAKQAITDLGFSWVVINEDGLLNAPGPEVPGRFNLTIREGIVVRQTVDGIEPFVNVNAMGTLEAQDLIESKGWTHRVTVINGVKVIEDDSFEIGRYNLWVTTTGEVVFHEIDLVRLDEIWTPTATE